MIYCNEIYDNTDDDFPLKNIQIPLKNIQIIANDNTAQYVESTRTPLSLPKQSFTLKADLVDSSHSITINTAIDNDLSIAVDGCDNGKKLTSDLQSQIEELNDKLNNVISELENFNKNIDDVKKEIASEADNDILYSNVYEYCLKIIENKFA